MPTICYMSEQLRDIAAGLNKTNPEAAKSIINLANKIQNSGTAMEKRLRKYKTAIERLGFKRNKVK